MTEPKHVILESSNIFSVTYKHIAKPRGPTAIIVVDKIRNLNGVICEASSTSLIKILKNNLKKKCVKPP